MGSYSVPIWLYPLAVVFTVLIQIICQSGALVKAVRTPVRDIIFSTRDTAYTLSIKKVIIGAVLLDVTREAMAAKARRKEAGAKA